MKTKPLPLLAPDSDTHTHTHTLTKVTTVYFWMNMQKSASMLPWTYRGHPTYPAPYPAVPPVSSCISTSCCKRALQASIFRGDRHLFSQAPSDGHGCGVQFFFFLLQTSVQKHPGSSALARLWEFIWGMGWRKRLHEFKVDILWILVFDTLCQVALHRGWDHLHSCL